MRYEFDRVRNTAERQGIISDMRYALLSNMDQKDVPPLSKLVGHSSKFPLAEKKESVLFFVDR